MVKNDKSIPYILKVMLYVFMVENEKYIQHTFKAILYIFMVENDECIHHILKVILFIFRVENDECIHHNLLKEEKEECLFNCKDLKRFVKNLNEKSRNMLCLQYLNKDQQ